MKIAICEDNRAVAAEAENYILELHLKELICNVFYDGSSLLKYLEKVKQGYQIYLLDIQMPGLDGIKTANCIRQRDKNAIIIFMTDYKEFVYDVFETLPFRFLSKPITRHKLQSAICDAVDYLYTVQRFLTFSIDNVQYQIVYDEILFLESDKRKVHLYTLSEEYIFYGKLTNIVSTVDRNIFARLHVSYLVNLGHIRKITKDQAELDNGVILPISKKYKDSIREQQINFVKWRNGI